MSENFNCAYTRSMPVGDLVPNPKNNNQHSSEQIDRLAKIINFQGQRSPIVVSVRSGFIVKGHARLAAIIKLGWSSAAVDYQDYASEAQEYADMTADNEIARWADLDMRQLSVDLGDFPELDLELLGIEDFKLPDAEKLEPQCDEDEVPDSAPTRCRPGDVWTLGGHRLMCGDSTMIDSVEKLMGGHAPNLMVTDPPYGVSLSMAKRETAKWLGANNANTVQNDDRADWYDAWVLFPGNVAYVWHASAFTDVVMDSLRRAAFDLKQLLIWNKSVLIIGRSFYHWKHEPCWYAVRHGKDHSWVGDRKQTTVWDAAPPSQIMSGSKDDKTDHPTQKPLLIYEKPIQNHTKEGDFLYEPFGGSGTCIIACEKTGRRSLTMELDPKYCDVILARWERYTGKVATLDSNNAGIV